MAILICKKEYISDPEVWDLIDGFFDSIEIVQKDQIGIIMRVHNDEVPFEDNLIDLVPCWHWGIRPFVAEVVVYDIYKV